MLTEILAIRLGHAPEEVVDVRLLGRSLRVRRVSAANLEAVRDLMQVHDGRVAVVALEGMARRLRVGPRKEEHEGIAPLFEVAQHTPVVDGTGLRDALERWAVRLVSQSHPGTFSGKRILMVPGLNHMGLAQALDTYAESVHFADNVIYFALSGSGAISSQTGLARYAGPALRQLRHLPPDRLWPPAGQVAQKRTDSPFRWADVLAGDVGTIRRYAPTDLSGKTVVVEAVSAEDLVALRERGVAQLITTMPTLAPGESEATEPAHLSAAIVEALFAALREHESDPLAEATYLNLMADLQWQPAVVHFQAQPEQAHRFAYVMVPLTAAAVRGHPGLSFTRFLPSRLAEPLAARVDPAVVGRIRGIQSITTGQKVDGVLLSLSTTPNELSRRGPAFAYQQLVQAARLAERMGAHLMGLSSVAATADEAGANVADAADIAITSGKSLALAATLETAQRIVTRMGVADLRGATAMVLGATGPTGAACCQLLARTIHHLVLVAQQPEQLIVLKRQIERENPGVQIAITTATDESLGGVDLVVVAGAAFSPHALAITHCRPGAVICDLTWPSRLVEEAAVRPDVMVMDSALVRIPGEVELSRDDGLPPATVDACLAETVLLALEGRFESYSRGRDLHLGQVEEIWQLFQKHQFQLVGPLSQERLISEETIAHKRALADDLRANPQQIERIRLAQQVAAETAEPIDASPLADLWPAGLAGLGLATAIVGWWTRRRNEGNGGQ